MTFTEDFNSELEIVKSGIQDLFDRSKEQILSLEDKSNSSFTELSSIYRRDTPLEDTFVDGSKISSTDGLVYDKDGWTNSFRVEEVKFLPEYYSRKTFPMSMAGGKVIPGSDFSQVFNDLYGFWGYMREDQTEVDASFTLSLDTINGTPEINKVYLRTNNELEVEAFYRASEEATWTSLGKRTGQHHVWTEFFSATEMAFTAKTTIFPVSLIQVGRAYFGLTGTLTSTYHEVDNLRLLSVDKDADIPDGTAIRTFINLASSDDSTPPGSGLISWEEEAPVLLAAEEVAAPAYSGYIIPSGFIEESLSVREGYNTWDVVDTIDYSIVTESVDRLSTTYLDIPEGYKVVAGGVRALYTGEGESRTTYSEGDDYSPVYDLDNDTIQIIYPSGGRLPTSPEVQPTAEVTLRRPNQVTQRRVFVDLEIDRDITISIPTTGIQVRTLHIGDTIEDEVTVQDAPVGTYTFSGKEGLNLIEVENYNENNPPVLVGGYKYYSTRYRLKKSDITPPGANKFYLEPSGGGLKLVTSEENLFIRYLVPTTNNFVSVRFELVGSEDVSPTLRGYKLTNRIDK